MSVNFAFNYNVINGTSGNFGFRYLFRTFGLTTINSIFDNISKDELKIWRTLELRFSGLPDWQDFWLR